VPSKLCEVTYFLDASADRGSICCQTAGSPDHILHHRAACLAGLDSCVALRCLGNADRVITVEFELVARLP
jgi:hypothetical protein